MHLLYNVHFHLHFINQVAAHFAPIVNRGRLGDVRMGAPGHLARNRESRILAVRTEVPERLPLKTHERLSKSTHTGRINASSGRGSKRPRVSRRSLSCDPSISHFPILFHCTATPL
jgi:hypothetical protein